MPMTIQVPIDDVVYTEKAMGTYILSKNGWMRRMAWFPKSVVMDFKKTYVDSQGRSFMKGTRFVSITMSDWVYESKFDKDWTFDGIVFDPDDCKADRYDARTKEGVERCG